MSDAVDEYLARYGDPLRPVRGGAGFSAGVSLGRKSLGRTLLDAAQELPSGLGVATAALRHPHEALDAVRQAGRGFTEGANALLRGTAAGGAALDRATHGVARYLPVVGSLAGTMHDQPEIEQQLAEDADTIHQTFGDPEGTAGVVGGIGGRLGFDAATAVAMGGVAGAGAEGLPYLARAGRMLAGSAPLTALLAQNQDTSITGALADATDNPALDAVAGNRAARTAADVALDFGAGQVLAEGVPALFRAGKSALAGVRSPVERGRAIGAQLAEDIRRGAVDLSPPPPPAPAPVVAPEAAGESLAAEGAAARAEGRLLPVSMDDPRLAAPTPTSVRRAAAEKEAQAARDMMFRVPSPQPQPPAMNGSAEQALVDGLARTGVGVAAGGAVGAGLDDEHPERGALLGAAAGGALGAAGPTLAREAERALGNEIGAVGDIAAHLPEGAGGSGAAKYLPRAAAQAAVGGAAGAALDEDHPVEGAVAGAAFGALAAPGSWERLQGLRGHIAETVWNHSPAAGRIVFTHDRLPTGYREAKVVLRRSTNEAQMVAGEIAQRARQYPAEVQRLLSELADSGAPHEEVISRLASAGVDNPDEAAALVRDTHELFGGLAEDLFGLNMLSRESIEKHGGRYLPRYYRAASEAAEGAGRPPLPVGPRTELDESSLGRLAQRADEVSPEMEARRIDHFGYRATAGALQEGKLVAGERFFQTVRAMDDVTHQEVRNLADQLREARAARSAIPAGADTEFRAASQEISRLREQLKAAENSASEAGFVKLDDSPKLGSLRGMYVTPEVAEDLAGLTRKRSLMGDAVDFYDRWFRRWKAGKTVLNPATHFRNIYGAQMLSWMGGGPVPFGSDYRRAWSIVRKAANPSALTGEQAAVYREARAAGLLDSGALIAETEAPRFRRGFAVNAPGEDTEEVASTAGRLSAARSLPARGYDAAARLYASEDVAARLAHYLYQRGKGLSPSSAAALASKWVPTFTDQSNLVKNWSRVVPFLGYTAAALPRVAEAASTRPARFLAAGALTYGLGKLLYGGQDVPEEVMPPEMRSGMTGALLPRFIPVPGAQPGERNYLDFTYITPWGDIGESRTSGHGVLDGLPMQLNPMSNPLVGTIAQLTLNKDRLTGREITRLSDTPGEKLQRGADYVYKQAMPSLAPPIPGLTDPGGDRTGGGWGYAALHDAITGKPNFRGDVRSVPWTVAGTLFGLKNREINPEEEYGRRLAEVQDELKDARSVMRRIQRDRGASEEAKREARATYHEKAQRLNELLRHFGELHAQMQRSTGDLSAAEPAPDAVSDYLKQYGPR